MAITFGLNGNELSIADDAIVVGFCDIDASSGSVIIVSNFEIIDTRKDYAVELINHVEEYALSKNIRRATAIPSMGQSALFWERLGYYGKTGRYFKRLYSRKYKPTPVEERKIAAAFVNLCIDYFFADGSWGRELVQCVDRPKNSIPHQLMYTENLFIKPDYIIGYIAVRPNGTIVIGVPGIVATKYTIESWTIKSPPCVPAAVIRPSWYVKQLEEDHIALRKQMSKARANSDKYR